MKPILSEKTKPTDIFVPVLSNDATVSLRAVFQACLVTRNLSINATEIRSSTPRNLRKGFLALGG